MKKYSIFLVATLLGFNVNAENCKKRSLSTEESLVLQAGSRLNDIQLIQKVLNNKCVDMNLPVKDGKVLFENPAFSSGSSEVLDYYRKKGNKLYSWIDNTPLEEKFFSIDNPYVVTGTIANENRLLFTKYVKNPDYLKLEKNIKWNQKTNDQYGYANLLLELALDNKNINKKYQFKPSYYFAYNGFSEQLTKYNEVKNNQEDKTNELVFTLNHNCTFNKRQLEIIGHQYGSILKNAKINIKEKISTATEQPHVRNRPNQYTNISSLFRNYEAVGKNPSKGLIMMYTQSENKELYDTLLDWGYDIGLQQINFCKSISEEIEVETQKEMFDNGMFR